MHSLTRRCRWDVRAAAAVAVAASVQALLTEESEWSAISNLDAFFSKVYTYYIEKGFWCMIAARVTNLMSVSDS